MNGTLVFSSHLKRISRFYTYIHTYIHTYMSTTPMVSKLKFFPLRKKVRFLSDYLVEAHIDGTSGIRDVKIIFL